MNDFGGNREKAILRDKQRCVKCGMTRKQHKKTYKKDITVDHIKGGGRNSKKKNHAMSNLQTLCLSCHGKKDNQTVKLNQNNVDEIRRRIKSGEAILCICSDFNISKFTVYDIKFGRTWRLVSTPTISEEET